MRDPRAARRGRARGLSGRCAPGMYEALSGAGIHPDRIADTSIDAMNAAIIPLQWVVEGKPRRDIGLPGRSLERSWRVSANHVRSDDAENPAAPMRAPTSSSMFRGCGVAAGLLEEVPRRAKE